MKIKNGFTIIELLVVIAIIGLIAALAMVSLNSARVKARDARRISDLRQIQTALEVFYNQTGKYPQSPSQGNWSRRWASFSTCLESGLNCGFIVTNYTPAISQVPQDPNRPSGLNPFANGETYYIGQPAGCTDGQSYRLVAYLEMDNNALNSDIDGSYDNNNNGCDDSIYGYCVGIGTCNGW